MIIGLTGKYASGKGEVGRLLHLKGYAYFSLADVLREEVSRRGWPADRDTLIKTGQALRKEEGPGVLARRLLPRLTGKDVVDSIRHPEEIRVLRSRDRMMLIGVDADPRIRFERMRSRNRFGDAVTFEEFSRQEAMEDREESHAQQLSACLKLADHVIDNSGTLDALAREVEKILGRIA